MYIQHASMRLLEPGDKTLLWTPRIIHQPMMMHWSLILEVKCSALPSGLSDDIHLRLHDVRIHYVFLAKSASASLQSTMDGATLICFLLATHEQEVDWKAGRSW